MPNRILRDWTNSEKVESISFQAEVLFVRLFMKADDYGCFYANPKLVKAALFPLKDVRESDISRFMDECQKAGLIVFYESEGKKYLQINNFGQRLRAMRNKFPPPAGKPQPIVSDPPPETNPKQESESENLIIIAGEKFFKKGSEILQNEYKSVLDQHLMGVLREFNQQEILEKFDLEYPAYEFKDKNHLSNAVKKLGEKILKEKNFIKKENGKANRTLDTLDVVNRLIRK